MSNLLQQSLVKTLQACPLYPSPYSITEATTKVTVPGHKGLWQEEMSQMEISHFSTWDAVNAQ